MKTFQMVVLTNVLVVVIVALLLLLWPMIGAIVGYGQSWWVAPLAAFGGFLIAGRMIRDVDLDSALRAQLAVWGVFCFGTMTWSLLVQNLGIPAWRIVFTLALGAAGTWLGRIVLGSRR